MNDEAMTEQVTWDIHRTDGTVVGTGFPHPAAAIARIRASYGRVDLADFSLIEQHEWVPAEPLPFYRRRNPLAALVAWARGDSDPWWEHQR